MTTDNPTPKPEPEVALAYPDPRIRRLAQIRQNYEQAIANLDAIRASKLANGGSR